MEFNIILFYSKLTFFRFWKNVGDRGAGGTLVNSRGAGGAGIFKGTTGLDLKFPQAGNCKN